MLIRTLDPYGSTESTRVDGELVSALLTWDSKVTTVVALLGGVTDLVRQKMKADGIYNEFIHIAKVCSLQSPGCTEHPALCSLAQLNYVLIIAQREYSLVFDELKGEDVDFCLPKATVPDAGLEDFTACRQ